ncbi:hypothetical protein Clacol_009328 [Clathrus columnatus]|uniref:Uncharacterized protein n=1 Tax=Clathrus columnatus TaxID=1419009 RepID=A0AAV5APT6_9AGAM|nr:hypothetical protein Clacol_009328 [Clathrus columnatus]
MNVYICIRWILHSLLFLVNSLSLTVASLTVATLKGQGHKGPFKFEFLFPPSSTLRLPLATAGPVLIILGFIFYAFVTICIWSETYIPRSRLSRNRTEAIILPCLFVFQIIGAIVATVDASKGRCHGQASCVALLILSWMSALTLLVYYFIVMTVTLYHFVSNENIWDDSPLGYNWFPLPSESVLPAVPPKDTDTNMTSNLPMDTNRPPSVDIDIEIASIEPPPPRSQNGHRRKISSWKPAPLDADSKATTSATSGSQLRLPLDVPSSPSDSTEAFEDIPIDRPSRLPEPEITPKFSLNEYIAIMSFGGPEWAKNYGRRNREWICLFPL